MAETTKKTSNPTKNTKTKFSIFRPLIAVIIILLLICLGVIGWQTYINQKQLQTLQDTVQKTQAQLTQQFDALQTIQTKLHQADWILPEIKYLLNLADINLTVNNNIPVAIKLLQTADKRIATLNDPALNELRHALANDISALQAVPQVDVVGIIYRLDTISDQITQISLIPKAPAKQKPIAQKPKPQDKTRSFWQRLYQTSLPTLENIVIIRHHEDQVQPILTTTQQIYLVQNIKISLEQAKWAVIHKQAKIYQTALQQARKLIKYGYAHNLAAAQNVLDTLQELQKIDISPTIPGISASTNALRKATRESITGKASS